MRRRAPQELKQPTNSSSLDSPRLIAGVFALASLHSGGPTCQIDKLPLVPRRRASTLLQKSIRRICSLLCLACSVFSKTPTGRTMHSHIYGCAVLGNISRALRYDLEPHITYRAERCPLSFIRGPYSVHLVIGKNFSVLYCHDLSLCPTQHQASVPLIC